MTMKTFTFILTMNTVNPTVFFDRLSSEQMVAIKKRIDEAVTADDAQKIINDYV